MSETSPLYRRVFDRLKDAKVGISTTLGMVAINLMCGDSNLSVYSDESLKKQLEMAVPSAFATPDTTGVKALDFGSVAVLMGASVEAARRTTSYTGIAATALSAAKEVPATQRRRPAFGNRFDGCVMTDSRRGEGTFGQCRGPTRAT